MINNDGGNVILNDEQTRAIEETKSRLFNLESEISIANKNLKAIKAESERAIKDKSYQEQLLSEVIAKVSSARSSLAEIEPQIVEKTALLNDLLNTIREESVIHETKSNELKDREDKIIVKEKQNSEQYALLIATRNSLASSQAEHNAKVARLREFMNTL